MITLANGPQPADILLLGEYPSTNSLKSNEPFGGWSGKELDKMLNEVGILRSECRTSLVTSVIPPEGKIENFFPTKGKLKGGEALYQNRYCTKEIMTGVMELQRELAVTKPKLIIALGDTALWALTGEISVSKWRGSILKHSSGAWIIPTYSPSMILKMWSWRFIAVQDLRRAAEQLKAPVMEPDWNFIVAPSFDETITALHFLYTRLETCNLTIDKLPLAVDIETRSGHIDCIGIAWSKTEAICIPFCSMLNGHYWSLEEEAVILQLLRKVLTHRNAGVIGQNFPYDAMYMAKHWGWYPTPLFDTMIGHAVAFPGLPKALDFLSSLYLPYHRYWKDESKTADTKVDDSIRWEYNCKDCCVTFECQEHIEKALKKENLFHQFQFEMNLFDPLMQMMMRGVRINEPLRSRFSLELLDEIAVHEDWLQRLGCGVWLPSELTKTSKASPWYRSPTQQNTIFYKMLGMEVVRNRKTGRPTVDDEALKTFSRKEPIMIPIVNKLLDYRSLGVFYSTFVSANLDSDNRVRTSYHVVGTETFRFSSSIDVFGKGMNLQNISDGKKD